MTQNFKNMLYLFGAAATGKPIDIKYCENLSKIRDLALSQEVWDVIYAGIRPEIESGSIKLPSEVYAVLEQKFMSNVALNIRKIEFNLKTLRLLEENGIRCCVLKGITVARLYSMPEARISSDMDVLIESQNEAEAVKILTGLGYECEERSKYDHHIKAYHKIGGLFEVHVALHSVATSDIILDDEVHYEEEFMLLEDGIYSLSVNDSLMYLSAHLIKHLINDATGIRQMMDLLLYMEAYEAQIDWEKYNDLMKRLGYDNLIRVIKGIGVRFFCMEFEDVITEGHGLEELLEDCEIGGVFGINEEERSRFYELFTRRRSGNSNLKHSMLKLTKSENSAFRMIFPKYKSMKERFGYVKKCPILLPIGWIHRIIEIILRQMGIISDKKENLTVNQRRMQMVEKLGMFKNNK